MPRCQAIHALSLGRIPIAANHGRREAALIDIDGLQTALDVPRPTAQEPSSLPRAALFVACRFFPGPSHLVQRVPNAMTRDPEMLSGDTLPIGSLTFEFVQARLHAAIADSAE